MGWLSFLVCLAPVLILFRSGHPVLWMAATANAALNLWSFGVMYNYAVERSAERIRRLRENLMAEGRLDLPAQRRLDSLQVTKDLSAVPSWLTSINMLSAVAGLVLLIWAVVI